MAPEDQFLIDEVSRRRRELGLSLRDLASETGISFSSLGRMERGEGGPGNLARLRLTAWMHDEDPFRIQRAPRLLDAWLKKAIETIVDQRLEARLGEIMGEQNIRFRLDQCDSVEDLAVLVGDWENTAMERSQRGSLEKDTRTYYQGVADALQQVRLSFQRLNVGIKTMKHQGTAEVPEAGAKPTETVTPTETPES